MFSGSLEVLIKQNAVQTKLTELITSKETYRMASFPFKMQQHLRATKRSNAFGFLTQCRDTLSCD